LSGLSLRPAQPGSRAGQSASCPASGRHAATLAACPSPGARSASSHMAATASQSTSSCGIPRSSLIAARVAASSEATGPPRCALGAPGRVMLRIAVTNAARSPASSTGSLSTPASGCSPASHRYTDHGHGYPGRAPRPRAPRDARGQVGREARQPLPLHQHVPGPALHQRQPYHHVAAQPVHGIDRAAGRPPLHRQLRLLRETARRSASVQGHRQWGSYRDASAPVLTARHPTTASRPASNAFPAGNFVARPDSTRRLSHCVTVAGRAHRALTRI